jgi:hypothetical protein
MSLISEKLKEEIKDYIRYGIPDYQIRVDIIHYHLKGMLSDDDVTEIDNLLNERNSKKSNGDTAPCSVYDDGQCCLTLSPCDTCISKVNEDKKS